MAQQSAVAARPFTPGTRVRRPGHTARRSWLQDDQPRAGTAQPPLNILVVDDQVTVLRFLAEALAQQGHTVTTSTNGRRGLETFRQGYFDLVLTDRNMPVMSGDELAAAVKELSPDTPVIMVTGSDIATSGEDNRPAGVDSILGKPVSLDTLRQALSQVR